MTTDDPPIDQEPGDDAPGSALPAAPAQRKPIEVRRIVPPNRATPDDIAKMLERVEPPAIIVDATPFAQYAYAEFFTAKIPNANTRKAYKRAVDRFLSWCDLRGIAFGEISAVVVSEYMDEHLYKASGEPLAAPTKKQHLAALKHFFDAQETRHGVLMNPAAPVRGPKHVVRKGSTRPFSEGQVKEMLESIDTSHVVGLRDRAILAVLHFTAARAGAVAKLRLSDYFHDGKRWRFDFGEKGGKPHAVKAAFELQVYLTEYLEAAGITGDSKDWPLFRSAVGKTKTLAPYRPPDPAVGRKARGGLTGDDVLRIVKRRLKDAELPPDTFTAHSFRSSTATALRKKGVPIEKVQHLLGHADARTTSLYDHSSEHEDEDVVDNITL